MEHLQTFFHEFTNNLVHNLFKPLLLFFYMGFAIPLFRVKFEFPHVIYQGITLYLLIAIGWHGGEELAALSHGEFVQAAGFMVIGFITNTIIGIIAYFGLRAVTRMRRIDAATVGGYYGSDSAGTFVTCLGVLATAQIAYAAYMPVMLAIMEIPGCLVALFLVSRMRHSGMDRAGNMPGEPGYIVPEDPTLEAGAIGEPAVALAVAHATKDVQTTTGQYHQTAVAAAPAHAASLHHGNGHGDEHGHGEENGHDEENGHGNGKPHSFFSPKVLHEVFLNPGLYLLFGGIIIGFICRKQGTSVTRDNDWLFVTLFQGMLCLFLLEMGITACKRLRDLRTAGWGFIAFGLIAPNIFACIGITVAHLYSHAIGEEFALGTYALFAVLCGAASYIAVPAVQRLAIPEASPTLPLAASLGLTFSYNVTLGIPIYIEVARAVTSIWPVAA